MCDIAALGEVDAQDFPGEFIENIENFHIFCEKTIPVRIAKYSLKEQDEFSIYVFSHTGEWIQGKAKTWFSPIPMFWAEWEKNIEGGTSGSPIVNDDGELVGIMSSAGGSSGSYTTGKVPYPFETLPGWIVKLILHRR